MDAFLHALLDWIGAHPSWAYITVFLIAFTESLAIVGLFMPGAILMFGVGALVASDALALWPTLAWAMAGAVAGDGLSFWLGRHYHMRLKVLWPFRRYPELIARGVDFFHKHGGKSIAFGRFVGPVRPIIPAVAGMLGMPVYLFVSVNVLSALAWAPAYILPGLVFGASLNVAAEVAGRLAILVLSVLALLWFSAWLARRVFLFLHPRAGAMIGRTLTWSVAHPRLGPLATALVDPRRPESPALAVFALVLIVAGLAFFLLAAEAGTETGPGSVDENVYHLLQGLRTPWMDAVMVGITQLADAWVYGPVVIAVLLWLLVRRHLFAAAHWLAAIVFGLIVTRLVKLATQVPRPTALYEGVEAFAFPSGHAAVSTTLFGFLAVLVAREINERHRWLAYSLAAALIMIVAFSRLYLGAHWLSDAAGGIALGLTWVALLGIAYRRHATQHVSPGGILSITFMAFLVVGTWHISQNLERDLVRYAPRHSLQMLAADAWWRTGWQSLPSHRIDLAGEAEQPLNLQWAGTLETLTERLKDKGWTRPPALTAANSLLWLSPQPSLARLPALPQVHDGRHESLLLVHATEDPAREWALRLWPADARLDDKETLWVGTVSELRLERVLSLFAVAVTGDDFVTPMTALQSGLGGLSWRLAKRRSLTPGEGRWQGETLLVRESPRPTSRTLK